MPTPTYTRADLGCWIDGAFGAPHAVEKMRRMLTACDGLTVEHRALTEEQPEDGLTSWEESEFCWEYLDDATEALYDYTAPGLVWLWECGDLILTEEGEDI